MYKLKNKLYWIVAMNFLDFGIANTEKLLTNSLFDKVNMLLTEWVGTYSYTIYKIVLIPAIMIIAYKLIKKYELSSMKIITYTVNACIVVYVISLISHFNFILRMVI
jgi:hypothetical protein